MQLLTIPAGGSGLPQGTWQWAVALVFVGNLLWLLACYCAAHYGGSRRIALPVFEGVGLAVMAGLLLRYQSLNATVLQAVPVMLILLVASWADIRTREVEDYLSVMLLLTALIGRSASEVPQMLLSGILIALPAFLVGFITKGQGIGGADIKLTAACGAVFGLPGGWIGLLLGLCLALLANGLLRAVRKAEKNEGFPMIPYLAVGFFCVYFLF